MLLITHVVLTRGDGAGENPFSSFFPVLSGFFILDYFLPTFAVYGVVYLSWIFVIFSLCYAFKPFLPSTGGCTFLWAMCNFCKYTQGPLLSSSVCTLQGSQEDRITLRNHVAVYERVRVSDRVCFNSAFLLLLTSWLMVSLFWLRITTALLAHSLACLTTWSILGHCAVFNLHQSWRVCHIMFLLAVSDFHALYADHYIQNYSWFQLQLLKRFHRRAKELRSVGDHLYKLDTYKPTGLGRVYLRLPRGLANITVKPRFNIFDRSWSSGEVPADWKRANITPIHRKGKKEDLGNYRWVSPTWDPWKIMEWVLMEAISRHEGEDNWEKSTPTSANSTLSQCQQFVVCFIIVSIEVWEADRTCEDQGKEGMKENLHISLCYL